MLTFESWWPLWLLALAPLLWWIALRSRTQLGVRQLVVLTVLRILAFVLLVLALMRPAWQAATRDVSVVYALDVSRSVAPAFVQSALNWIRSANTEQSPASARYVVFGERAVLLDDLEQVPKLAVTTVQPQAGALAQGATNIEAALDTALLGLDNDRIKRVVLLSDGNQTEGDVWRVLPRLQSERVRVFAFPATPRAQHDAWIETIEVAPGVRRDEPIAIAVRVVSQTAGKAAVRLSSGAGELGRQTVQLQAGVNNVAFRARLRRAGAQELVAEVKTAGDTIADNDRLQRSIWVGPRARVLYVEGQLENAHYLRDALTKEGIEVTAIAGADLASDAQTLAGYDAIIVSDVARSALDEQRLQALERYVRDEGGGLLYAGGETTYGQEGFSDTPLERVLPVEFKAQEKRRELALVVCLDRSYSMKGRSMELAKAATRAALNVLEEQHQFGVIAFDSQPHDTVPLQAVRSKRRAEDLIDRIQASGQTNIYAALATAFRWLQNAQPKNRHVILLSDGDTAPADFERLVKRMIDARITVSTVTIGKEADRELMEKLARWGRGRAYYAEDVSKVPQMFVEDTQNVSRATLIEEPFRPVVKRKIEALRGIDFAKAPLLRGFASTKLRDGAEVFLVSESGAPILSRWNYGLGRTAVFASDVKNRWATDWLQWEGYGKFWGQLVRDLLRRDKGEELAFSVTRTAASAQIQVQAQTRSAGWRNGLQLSVRMTRPGSQSQTVSLRQSAPGFYSATVPLGSASSEPYTFELQAAGGISREMSLRAGLQRLFYPYPDEYRTAAPNVALLQSLAEQTGGKLTPALAEIFDAGSDRGHQRRALWIWFAGAALIGYLLDIAARRAPWFRRWLDAATPIRSSV